MEKQLSCKSQGVLEPGYALGFWLQIFQHPWVSSKNPKHLKLTIATQEIMATLLPIT